jgi:hypothetical protein
VQRDSLKVFAAQQHHIISSDLRSVALILSRQRHAAQPSLMNVLQGEAAALDALHAFTEALEGVTHREVFEPLPAAHTYCAFVAWLRWQKHRCKPRLKK